MEWVIGATVAVMPFAIIAAVAIAARRRKTAHDRRIGSGRRDRITRNGANDEGVLLI